MAGKLDIAWANLQSQSRIFFNELDKIEEEKGIHPAKVQVRLYD